MFHKSSLKKKKSIDKNEDKIIFVLKKMLFRVGFIMGILEKLEKNGVHLSYEDVVRICEKYQLSELSVFGSVIRDDFGVDSDVDILISYENVWNNDPFDDLHIKWEFKELLNREIDIVDKDGLKNPIRREEILSTCEVIYAHP